MQLRVHGREQEFGIVVKRDFVPRRRGKDPEVWERLQTEYRKKFIGRLIVSVPKIVPAVVGTVGNHEDCWDIWLSNGSRIYQDSEVLEVSTAECLIGSLDLVRQELASEIILNKVIHLLREQSGIKICLYKNNAGRQATRFNQDLDAVDFEEVNRGSHHNYSFLAYRQKEIFSLFQNFIPVTLPFSGSGHVYRRDDGKWIYVFSQRAPEVTALRGADLIAIRPIVHIRNESLMKETSGLGRLHLISRDATRCEFQTWLVDMMTHLVVRLGEEGWELPKKFKLDDPIGDLESANEDLGLEKLFSTSGGKLDVFAYNRIFLDAVRGLQSLSEAEQKAIAAWEDRLAILAKRDFRKLVGEFDWATKLHLLKILEERYGFGMDDFRAQKVDLDYHNISASPKESWFAFLDRQGLIRHLVSQAEVRKAVLKPPPTRAQSRGEFVLQHASSRLIKNVTLMNWNHAEIGKYNFEFGGQDEPWQPGINKSLIK